MFNGRRFYVNREYQDDTPLGNLMKDFFCADPDKMHYPQLAKRTKYFKKEKEGVATMCKIMEDMRKEVERETTERVARETASKLLRSIGLSYEQVAECISLPLSEVKELAKTLGST